MNEQNRFKREIFFSVEIDITLGNIFSNILNLNTIYLLEVLLRI